MGAASIGSPGIQTDDRRRAEILALLTGAYRMEVETVMSYLAASINTDGVRAQDIRESLEEHVLEELGHAQELGRRIRELDGVVPGSLGFTPQQSYLQPPQSQLDLLHVVRGVIAAETGAIEHYTRIIDACEGADDVTQDMVIDILGDEERHRRLFEGFLRELESEDAGG